MLQLNRYTDRGKAISTMGTSEFLPKINSNDFSSVNTFPPNSEVYVSIRTVLCCHACIKHNVFRGTEECISSKFMESGEKIILCVGDNTKGPKPSKGRWIKYRWDKCNIAFIACDKCDKCNIACDKCDKNCAHAI